MRDTIEGLRLRVSSLEAQLANNHKRTAELTKELNELQDLMVSTALERDQVRVAIKVMADSFGDYETAITNAQRTQHNYEHWSSEEWVPIDTARTRFYTAYGTSNNYPSTRNNKRSRT